MILSKPSSGPLPHEGYRESHHHMDHHASCKQHPRRSHQVSCCLRAHHPVHHVRQHQQWKVGTEPLGRNAEMPEVAGGSIHFFAKLNLNISLPNMDGVDDVKGLLCDTFL